MHFEILTSDTLENNLKLLSFPKKYLKYILINADFYVNNQVVNLKEWVNKGESVFIVENENTAIKPVDMQLNILFEDEYLLIIDKPAKVSMLPTYAHPTNTLANAIINHYQKYNIKQTVHYITRLDFETSGIVLVAKTKWVKHLMQLQRHQIERIYLACVRGVVDQKGFVEAPLLKSDFGIKRVIDVNGKYALTYYEPLFSYQSKTLLKCRLETGRTHQIRVHLSSIGFPIVNDGIYGTIESELAMQLYCYKNTFCHPITCCPLKITSQIAKLYLQNSFHMKAFVSCT